MQQHSLYKHFATTMSGLLKSEQGLCVALSGGVDSVVLLHLCRQFCHQQRLPLQAIYVNHGLSKNALQWQAFCQQLCDQMQIDFQAICVTIEHKPRTSLEAQAREARYQALDSHAHPGFSLLLGQHGDDQIETFLLRLKRGSGLAGLGAMKASRKLKSGRRCLRPLLTVGREQIEAYRDEYNLRHIEDESNQNDRFDRNFLRNQVIPLLKSRFSGFVPSVLRTISILQAQQALIDEFTAEDLAVCQQGKELSIERLLGLSESRRDNVLRAWLAEKTHYSPSQKQLADLICQLQSNRADKQIKVSFSGGQIRQFQDLLYWVIPQPILENITVTDFSALNTMTKPVAVISGKGCRLPLPHEHVTIRFNCLNDKIRPLHKPGSNTIKHWLKDAGIPSWARDRIPVVYYDDKPVQIVGITVDADFSADCGINWVVEVND
ncbi:tRNA lysidine(34) synthetase TilS [Pseudoalteromonas sp. T1lg65]|uniref:tRNA lysidine(34) synthetase TilS n=1 Tax=Pseudoalteromonas sp. T1lg65 TaxID=2077101 RepID=UPI003F796F08